MMTSFIGIISILLTIIFYYCSKALYGRFRFVLFSPLLVAPAALIIGLLTFHISYSSYITGGKWLTVLLQPAIVAFALPLYKHYETLKKHFPEIVLSVLAGTFSAFLSSALLGLLANFQPQIIASLAPRSVTTPIAIDVSNNLGGVPSLTAVFVILTGLMGLVIGPLLIRFLHLHSPIAKGILLGTGAHGCGTSAALTLGSLEGTIASLAMIFAGLATIILAPVVFPLLLKL
ncbi:LrgB family protein [Desulfosporosinus sp. PR]|uniref:LrgB family protein n=1 Tax=Candidatus Desulfosporosinus nitrosoreducens TaxID=3401928 RepID=UPI0027F39D0F|nr:LrgB family protein [Desulfosporosinus sp. PR]MDQ7097112.1 LrgB family protein [Desulfosporosinus sp. PR]